MKKLLLLVFVISFISYGQTPVSETFFKNQLKVEGTITPNNEEMDVMIYAHTFNSDSLNNWQLLGNEKMKSDYVINLNVGFIYLLHFIKPNGESKKVLIGASKEDYINVNVDFLKNKRKELYFIYEDDESHEYVQELLKNEYTLK